MATPDTSPTDLDLLRLPAPKEGKDRKDRAGKNGAKPRNWTTAESKAEASARDPDLARLLAEREGQTQRCNCCGETKPYSEFYLRRQLGKPIFLMECKACVSTKNNGRTANAIAVTFKYDKGLERKVGKNFTAMVLKRRALYRCDAMDALHDLAMMDCDGSPQLAAWKFQAAQFLAGGINEDGSQTNEFSSILARLDKAYRENAPRIKAVRERIIEFDGGTVVTEEKLVN